MTIRSIDALRSLALLLLVIFGVVTTVGSGGGGPTAKAIAVDDAVDPVTGAPVSDNVIVAHGGSVLVVNAASFDAGHEIALGTKPGSAFEFSADGSTFFPDSVTSHIGGFAADETQRSPLPVGGQHGTALGDQLYLTQSTAASDKVVIFNVSRETVIDLPLPGPPVAIAASPGTRVFALTLNSGGGAITVIDPGGRAASFPLPPGPGGDWRGIAVDPDDENLYVTSPSGLSIIDIKEGSQTIDTIVKTVPLSGTASEMAISGNRRLFVLTSGNGFTVIDIVPGSATRHTVVGSGPSGTNAFFIAANDSGVVYLADGSQATRFIPDSHEIYTADASLPLPRAPTGLGFHKGVNGLPDRLYVSLPAVRPVQFTLFDSDFPVLSPSIDIGWALRVLFDGTGSTPGVEVTTTSRASGGNGGGYLEIAHGWGGINVGGFEIVHTRSGATYLPSKSGAIDHIDWAFDTKAISVSAGLTGVGIFPMLCQGSDCFQLAYQQTTSTSWTHHDLRGLKEADFINPLSGPVHPDFSVGQISFGFGTGNFGGAIGANTTVSGVDNWTVTVVLKQ